MAKKEDHNDTNQKSNITDSKDFILLSNEMIEDPSDYMADENREEESFFQEMTVILEK